MCQVPHVLIKLPTTSVELQGFRKLGWKTLVGVEGGFLGDCRSALPSFLFPSKKKVGGREMVPSRGFCGFSGKRGPGRLGVSGSGTSRHPDAGFVGVMSRSAEQRCYYHAHVAGLALEPAAVEAAA